MEQIYAKVYYHILHYHLRYEFQELQNCTSVKMNLYSYSPFSQKRNKNLPLEYILQEDFGLERYADYDIQHYHQYLQCTRIDLLAL